jgi:hypothetical protein
MSKKIGKWEVDAYWHRYRDGSYYIPFAIELSICKKNSLSHIEDGEWIMEMYHDAHLMFHILNRGYVIVLTKKYGNKQTIQ